MSYLFGVAGLRSPHKLKSGVSGCVRECAEAQGKDFGLVATEKGYNLYVCGNGGAVARSVTPLPPPSQVSMNLTLTLTLIGTRLGTARGVVLGGAFVSLSRGKSLSSV